MDCGGFGTFVVKNGDVCINTRGCNHCYETKETMFAIYFGAPNQTVISHDIEYEAEDLYEIEALEPKELLQVMDLPRKCFEEDNFYDIDERLFERVMYINAKAATKIFPPCIMYFFPYETAGHYELEILTIVPEIQNVPRVSSLMLEKNNSHDIFFASVIKPLIFFDVLIATHRIFPR